MDSLRTDFGRQVCIEAQHPIATENTSSSNGGEIGQLAGDDLLDLADLDKSLSDEGRLVQLPPDTPGDSDQAQQFVGLSEPDTQIVRADETNQGVVRPPRETHSSNDHALIVNLWRQRQDLCRAQQRLNLQCQALCRRTSDGDKKVAASLWSKMKKNDEDTPLAMVLAPYRMGMDPLNQAQNAVEKQLAKIAKKHPLWLLWAVNVRGVGEASFAGLLGEAGRPVTDYRSVSALWKRFGLAVIDGGRQRRVAGDMALVHGYSPQRRSYAYIVSGNLLKAQGADGPYRLIYDARKSYELARDIPKAHAHNRAMRVMVKALLKDMWVAARELEKLS